MNIESLVVEIPLTEDLTTEYIEKELTKLNINPLRWAVTYVGDKMYKVSVANLKH